MDLQAQFGRRLAALREERGFSQHQLARAVGVSSQFVARIEAGARAPSFRVLGLLAEKLSVTPDRFFRSDGKHATSSDEREAPEHAQLRGAVRRLSPADLDLVLAFVRRLGRRA